MTSRQKIALSTQTCKSKQHHLSPKSRFDLQSCFRKPHVQNSSTWTTRRSKEACADWLRSSVSQTVARDRFTDKEPQPQRKTLEPRETNTNTAVSVRDRGLFPINSKEIFSDDFCLLRSPRPTSHQPLFPVHTLRNSTSDVCSLAEP